MTVFFSNRLEFLLEQLSEKLFSTGSDPFEKRLLIVPSSAMEQWVRLQLTDRLGICAGVQTLFLNQALTLLADTPLPTPLELIFQIEAELDDVEALVPYLKDKPQRRLPLCRQLSLLFGRYALYGQRVRKEGWQWDLWKRLFPTWRFSWNVAHDLPVHLFGFSHLSRLHLQFFSQLSETNIYHLSPCQEFWCDDLAPEHSPLLRHLGGVGRAFARLVVESDLPAVERYAAAEEKTQLSKLQNDLLYLRDNTATEDDGSLEIHQLPTPHREVENLYQLLLAEKVEPREMIVMAPDITLYAPYIQAIFRDLDYQITDLPTDTSPLFVLLELEKNRWSAPAILALAPIFGWNPSQITQWITLADIRWGFDLAHRSALIGHPSEGGGTWEEGFTALLWQLATTETLPMTEAEALGEWIETLRALYGALRPFHDEVPRTMRAWASHLRHLISLLPVPTHGAQIEKLVKAAAEKKYPFSFVRPLLVQDELATVHAHHLQAVRFCSLLPMRAIPARIICLLGMNDDAFPRRERLQSLDCLHNAPGTDYAPSRLDFDRSLFLEALLSAKEKVILSFSGEAPTPLLELLPTKNVITHPDDPFDSRYFDGTLRNFSLTDYAAAKTTLAPPKPEFTTFTLPPVQESVVDVTDLIRFVRSPLKYALRRLEISFYKEPELRAEEEFLLSPLTLAKVRSDQVLKALPLGSFREIARRKIAEQPRASFPSFELPPQKIGSVTIVGTLEGVSPGALHVMEKGDIRGAIRSWPAFLLLNLLEPTTLHFHRDGSVKEPFFSNPRPFLEALLALYVVENPTPLIPDLIAPLVHKDPAALAKSLQTSYDEGLKWVMRAHRLPPPDELIAQWHTYAKTLYGEMLDAWF